MKHPFILIFISFLCFRSVNAQKSEGTEYILNATEYKLAFDKKTFFDTNKLPFKDIVVYDYRYDTSKIGYVESGGGSGYSKIQLKQNWAGALNNYFKKNLDASSSQTLCIVIRSFWMQEGILDELSTKKVIQKSVGGKSDYDGNCKAQLDVYVQSGSALQAFFKLDTTFLNFYKFKQKKLEEWFFLPFDSIARKIISSDVPSVLSKRKKLSLEEVSSFYNKRFDLPILKGQLLQKGVFITFEDFKNNKPLLTDLRLEKGKLTDQLYVVQNGNENLLTEFWGFIDGKDLFIKAGFNVFIAVPQQNTFEVYGGKHISNYHNNPTQGDLLKINAMKVDRKILQLNMETGEFY